MEWIDLVALALVLCYISTVVMAAICFLIGLLMHILLN